MPQADLVTITGTKSQKISLPKEIFSYPVNPTLVAQSVRVNLGNQRRAHATAKTRGEVAGSGRKIWQQKGTGRARHGDRYAPIFVGGGVAHGPRGANYARKLSKPMTKKALFSVLSEKFKTGDVLIVKGLEEIKPKTKEMAKVVEKLALKGKILFVLPQALNNVMKAARNISNLTLTVVNNLNTYEVLNHQKIVFTEESIETLEKVFLKGKEK